MPPLGYTFVGANAADIAFDPLGRFAYVTINQGQVFAIDAASGALKLVATIPAATGSGRQTIAIDPTGRFVYALDPKSNAVSAFMIDPMTGALATVIGSPFVAQSGPSAVSIDPSGQFAYVTTASQRVLVFAIDQSSGALSQRSGMLTRDGPVAIAITSGRSPISDAPKFAYVTNTDTGTISGFAVDAIAGGLTEVPGSPFMAGTAPGSVTINSLGRVALVAAQVRVPYLLSRSIRAAAPSLQLRVRLIPRGQLRPR